MRDTPRPQESGIGLFAVKHIEEKLDPEAKLMVLTKEQIDIVVDRIYQKFQEQRKSVDVRKAD